MTTPRHKDVAATRVWFDRTTLWIELGDGRQVGTPLSRFPRLARATRKQRNGWRLIGSGDGIHWNELGEDLSVHALVAMSGVDDEMPEIDFTRCKVVRRGPPQDRKVSLDTLRGSLDLTQTQLAKKAGITRSAVSRAELRGDCSVSTLERYAKALNGELEIYVAIDGRKYPITLGRSRSSTRRGGP